MSEKESTYVGELELLEDSSYIHKDQLRRWKMYRTSCQCKDDRHQITIDLEDDDGIRALTFYTRTYLSAWSDRPYWWESRYEKKDLYPHFFSKLWGFLDDLKDYYIGVVKFRVKHAFKMLFTGYIEMESDFYIRGDKQILGIAEVIINFVNETYRRDDQEG